MRCELDACPRLNVVGEGRFVPGSAGNVVPNGSDEVLSCEWLKLGDVDDFVRNGISPGYVEVAHAI